MFNTPSKTNSSFKLMEFILGAESYCIDLLSVQEVVSVKDKIVPIPLSPEYVAGLINLRGNVFKIIDLRKKMGITPSHQEEVIIIFSIEGKMIGALVDSVRSILTVNTEQVQQISDLSLSRVSCKGAVKLKNSLSIWVDVVDFIKEDSAPTRHLDLGKIA